MTLSIEQRAELKRQAQQHLARQHFADYFPLANPTYYHMEHTRYISHYLNRIANGEQLNLLIELPPRHGKSALITETFPSYYLMKNPEKKVISTAYSDSLARKFGRLNRNKFREHGVALFGAEIADDNSSSGNWSTADGGGMISTGIMGSLTGEGADCFPEGTMITTEIGQIDIKELFEMTNPPRVLTFNHDTEKLEYKEIEAKRRVVADGLTEISTTSGIKIRSTNEHRYYTNRSNYKQAHLLGREDKLTVETVTQKHTLQDMQQREREPWDILSRVLSKNTKDDRDIRMHTLWSALRKTNVRVQQSIKSKSERLLLLAKMFERTSLIQELETVSSLWGSKTQRQQILWAIMLEPRTRVEKNNNLRKLQRNIYKKLHLSTMLFERLRRSIALKKNDREEQLKLQRRFELLERLRHRKSESSETRQQRMSGMFFILRHIYNEKRSSAQQSSRTSQRRRRDEQHTGKLNYSVCDVSCDSSQVRSESIQSVKSIEVNGVRVYDIQVADNHNFFANTILVHNCMIIDDPVKNRAEAYSKTYRDRVWDEWESTLSTRLHDGASVIVVQTRWHEDDLTGRLLENKGRKWVRIRIPAIAEEDDLIGREVGAALAPQLGYDTQWAKAKKTEVGSMTWNALYQQRPTSETGTIFKREWIQYYDTLPSRVNYYSISWDLAVKDGDNNDYSVGQCWAVIGADRYLIDQVRAKLNFTDMIKTVRAFKNKHRKAREIIIEDKANGPAVIDTLKREIPGIIPFNPRGSKEERAMSASVLFEAGNVFIPKNAPWVHDYVEELIGFPGFKWDDSVDATTQFIIRSLESRPARSFSNNAW